MVVKVNGVSKTVAIKAGESSPTTEFVYNSNEKYVENGTYGILTSSDTLHVDFTYNVPIRVKRRNLASISAMQVLFPETNGEFTTVLNDASINALAFAYDFAKQRLDSYSPPMVTCSFDTYDDIFNAGESIYINDPAFTGNAVIQTITSKQIAGGNWKHSIKCMTVLYGFEEMLREILAAKKVELIDGEILETSQDYEDEIGMDDVLTASIDQNRQTDDIGLDDDLAVNTNFGEQYVLGPYFPADHADTKRVFILDGSPMT